MDGNFEQAKAFFLQGLDHYQAGRYERAEAHFAASLALVPDRASTLTNLGAARLKLGRFEEALAVLEEALAQDPDNVEALGHRAAALAELGRPAQALACADRALALNQGLGPLWTLRGTLLKELGRPADAASSFESAITHGADPELNRYYLAGLSRTAVPPTPPRVYVESLFDSYADGFEEHLVEALRYRAPQLLVEGLHGRRFERVLDLGCGTGLCGAALRPFADDLEGVDLSESMVARARQRGVYDRVTRADLNEHLRIARPGIDLVIAADVFIYVGALEKVFAGVRRVLRPGGVFCFTVELADESLPLQLRASLRYAHSRGYIRTLAEQNGFEFSATSEHPIRDDQRTPIPGLFAWLSAP
jgi:predicted TPR repeat methyltransferase